MGAIKRMHATFDEAWLDDALDVLNQEARAWRDQKEEELLQAENKRHEKLAADYQAKLDKAFKSKKSKELMVANLSFVTEIYEGKRYVKFEGTIFTGEEFKERVNYLFKVHVENLWAAQLEIEAAEEAKQLKVNAAIENAIAAMNVKADKVGSKKEENQKKSAKVKKDNALSLSEETEK